MTLEGARASVLSKGCPRFSSFEGSFSGHSYQRPSVRRSFPPFIALATTTSLVRTITLTATTTFIATTPLRFTSLRLTPNCRMGDIAQRTGLTRPKSAIGDTPINMVVHIRLFTLFPMFGTQN